MKVGIVVRSGFGAPGVLRSIRQAEEAGLDAVWMSGGSGSEMLTTLAVAATQTSRLKLGTAIVQMPLRHPVALAHEARTIAQLGPGRFRLGVGPSHGPLMEPLGLKLGSPLSNLREYVTILKALLQTGSVRYEGSAYAVSHSFGDAVDVPVMVSALRSASFELAGEVADAAISWFCPPKYLRTVAMPAMSKAAEKAGREVPPLIAHVLVCLTKDRARVGAIARQPSMTAPLRLPFYQRMFIDSGFPEAASGEWSDAMLEGTIVYGDDNHIAQRLRDIVDAGNVELMVSLMDPDEASLKDAVMRLATVARR